MRYRLHIHRWWSNANQRGHSLYTPSSSPKNKPTSFVLRHSLARSSSTKKDLTWRDAMADSCSTSGSGDSPPHTHTHTHTSRLLYSFTEVTLSNGNFCRGERDSYVRGWAENIAKSLKRERKFSGGSKRRDAESSIRERAWLNQWGWSTRGDAFLFVYQILYGGDPPPKKTYINHTMHSVCYFYSFPVENESMDGLELDFTFPEELLGGGGDCVPEEAQMQWYSSLLRLNFTTTKAEHEHAPSTYLILLEYHY